MRAPRRFERSTVIAVDPARLFAVLDDPARLGAHMGKPSAAMLGGSMTYALDAAGGQAVGSVIRMTGTVLGLRLSVSEIITERTPPLRKAWETIGEPRLLILSWYRMGFEVAPEGAGSRLTVSIDYLLPEGAMALVGRLIGPSYARWCVSRIVDDATRMAAAGG